MRKFLPLEKENISESEKRSVFHKVIKSNEFSKSSTYKDLLTYLFDLSLKNETPKELNIAIDFFKKKTDFNPNDDSSVRQHIYYLREKLKKYYLVEGKNEKIRIFLPKGSYAIQFIKASFLRKKLTQHKHSFIYSFLFILISILLYQTMDIGPKEEVDHVLNTSMIWSDLKNSKKPDLVILGDTYFYWEYQKEIDDTVRVRNFKVNSPADLENLKSKFPSKKDLRTAKEIYFPKSTIWAFSKLSYLFATLDMKIGLIENSIITLNDIKNNDIVLIGNTKTIGLLGSIVTQALNIQFDPLIIHPEIVNNNSEQIFRSEKESFSFHKDFCLLVKIPGPKDNHILIITSNHQTGQNGVIDLLTNDTSLLEFEAMIKKEYNDPRYFIAVFEVSGFEMTNYKTELVYFEKIMQNNKLW